MQSRASSELKNLYTRAQLVPISTYVRSTRLKLVRSNRCFDYSGTPTPRREDYRPNSHVARSNWLVTKLSKEGRIGEARKLFDELPDRDVIAWSALITGYIRLGFMDEARQLFYRADSKKNVVTWTAMLNAYLKLKRFPEAEMLFHEMPEKNIVSWNTMINGYAQNGRLDKAYELFDKMPERNTVSWNTMIAALVQRGRTEEAMNLFEIMPKRDVISWTNVVSGLANDGRIDEARRVFDRMPERNIVSWNAMITGYTRNKRLEEAYELFQVMPERDLPSWNTMITGFIQNEEVNRAWNLFDRMPERNVISWTTMITGYVEKKQSEEALKVFSKMLRDGSVKPNVGTYLSVLSACTDLAGLVEGQQIHQVISKSVHQKNELVTSALINMYSKTGELIVARKIFDDGLASQRDLISWNGMIAAYAHHGHGKEAIELYNQMRKNGFKPNEVTYLNLLSACSHSGLVDKGMNFFEELVKDGSLQLREDHITCLVDLCGRAGRLKDVLEFINRVGIKPSGSIWGALLSACSVHGEAGIAKEVEQRVLVTGQGDAGTYMLLSNIYASCGKWKEAAGMRLRMKEKGMKKQPGCSWIQIGDQTHVFVIGDKSHSQFEAIYSALYDLHSKMKKKKMMNKGSEDISSEVYG
ncbi:PREDICTED: pentatricopeptide repeat-containing protein At2g35030, mitochondrial [Tarenaya hassleriana]|uniref:pentatricopeptide repeat-containing protein At2g35030, mitochondrial n=1 Tax=Tarenaya hassleriana TaxID=28532 RepID=UPI00053C5EB2|nr:PREDICTED: pentatricopeptide repeat-containing protein At2g35030, mitochondrial [Tarenaya hassleriana]